MRKVIDLQTKIWQTGIENIELDHKSRDEIPKLLIGLQYLYSNIETRDKVFKILKRLIPNNTNTKAGRPGMDLWKILVLGTLRLNCNWDYDKVHEIANNHRFVRLMLQHEENDWRRYGLQTIKDNVWLLSSEILDEINQVVVAEGHKLLLTDGEEPLKGNCDSFVVETNVHYPTDTNLLFDAVRKMIHLVAILCSEVGITDWRQHHKNISKMKRLLRSVELLWRSKPKKEAKKAERNERIMQTTTEYLDVARGYVSKVRFTISIMRGMGILNVFQDVRLLQIEEYIRHAERQIDQVERRAIHDEKIPHAEKVFSIFEPHTEWIQKGKAGVSQELGLRISVLKDQYGFILHHMIMERQTDEKIAVPIVQETKERFPTLASCSFDKG